MFQEDRKLSATFDVVAQPPAGYFTLINDPKLAAPLKASIVPGGFTVGAADPGSLHGDIRIRAVPANIAFDVFARCNGHEFRISSLTASQGSGADWSIGGNWTGSTAATRPATIDLILRSSESAERATVDLHSIWDGELIYPHIPLGVDPRR